MRLSPCGSSSGRVLLCVLGRWVVACKECLQQGGPVFTTPPARGLSASSCMLSHVRLCVTPWTVAHQALLSMGFSRQEHWSGLPGPPPGDLPDPGIESASLLSPTLAGRFFTASTTWEAVLLLQQVSDLSVLASPPPLPPSDTNCPAGTAQAGC